MKPIPLIKRFKSGVGYLLYTTEVDRIREYKRIVLFYLPNGARYLNHRKKDELGLNSCTTGYCVWDLMLSDDYIIDDAICLNDYVSGLPEITSMFELDEDEFGTQIVLEGL